MKQNIYNNFALTQKLRRKGQKVVSHGTHRAKRHPTSPRLAQLSG